MSDSVTPWTVARQAPWFMGFSRQEYWNVLPLPSPGDLPHSGIKLGLPHSRQILSYLSHQGRPGALPNTSKTFSLLITTHRKGTVLFSNIDEETEVHEY